MNRHISTDFVEDLLNGQLKPILTLVHDDASLDMEFRGDTVTLYYRGGAILNIHEDSKHVYSLSGLDPQYYSHKEINGQLCVPSLENYESYIKDAKHYMNQYVVRVKNNLGEKEIQQEIVKENNYSTNSTDTDYFVVDVEYADGDSRFDIVALRWKSDPQSRKSFKKFVVTIIEVKQGTNAVKTTFDKNGSTLNPGLRKHQSDYNKFVNSSKYSAFVQDMLMIFRQKAVLGLIKADRIERIGLDTNMSVLDEPEFVCILANYKKRRSVLSEELSTMENCHFFVSSFMGYGLYCDDIVDKNQILSMGIKIA